MIWHALKVCWTGLSSRLAVGQLVEAFGFVMMYVGLRSGHMSLTWAPPSSRL
jgi:hypothetical protein